MIAESPIGVVDGMHSIIDAVTQCKFEATYPAFDECVLNRILDVLVAAVRSPQGRLLTHDNIINVFQACYRIGHFQTEKGRETSELLTQSSRRAMKDLVYTIFSRLENMTGSGGSLGGGGGTALVSPSGGAVGTFTSTRLKVSPPPSSDGDADKEDETKEDGADQGVDGGSPQDPVVGVEENDTQNEESTALLSSSAITATPIPLTKEEKVPSHHEIVSLLSPNKQSGGGGGIPPQDVNTTTASSPSAATATTAPFTTTPFNQANILDESMLSFYNIDTLCEVLSFIISFVAAPPSRHSHSGLAAHGLELVLAALHAAGPSLEAHDPLICLIRQDLAKALFSAARDPSLVCLAGVCQVALAMYVYLSRHVLLQLEALLGLLLLPLAEGRGAASLDAQQIALEGVLDFCSQPGFVQDIYLNLDCRIERSNLFEQICTLLSKAAFPVNGPVASVHILSLDGIMAILSSLEGGIAAASNMAGMNSGEDGPLSSVDISSLLPLPSSPLAPGGGGGGGAAVTAPAAKAYVDIWSALVKGQPPPLLGENSTTTTTTTTHYATAAQLARAEKQIKSRLTAVAEHFNRDAKKGFQLCQSLNLLPPTLDPISVAGFLRRCPGLSKPGIGEVLGDRDAFYSAVREAFINTFDFTGLEFDVALRLYMDAFRPPGEGQKIDRIMQSFGQRYFEQMPEAGLKSADAAYVLAFSVIMLNTDLHNTQNKKKMSLADFSRINDNTNDGAPMPTDLLQRIYANISADELKISSECTPEELPGQIVFWQRLAQESLLPRGRMLVGARADASIERDMFTFVWGPTLAAVSVILDGSSDPGVARRAMHGLLIAAHLAAVHGIPDVADQLLNTLAKYTSACFLHSYSSGGGANGGGGSGGNGGTGGGLSVYYKPMVAFGENEKGRVAVEATFAIANRYGDGLRSGWRHVLECVIGVYKLGLLPPGVIAADGDEDPEETRKRLPQPLLAETKRASSSLFSRASHSLISIEGGGGEGGGGEAAAARDEGALVAAATTAEACHAEDLIADSKFLTAESLVELIKATMWAGGNVVVAARTGGEGTDTAELSLELLITLALRNRDRVGLIWPLIHEYIAACVSADSTDSATPLVQRAVAGLFRVCQRLLPYKEDTAETLLASLRLVGGLSPGAAWALAEPIATDTLMLLKTGAPYIRSEGDWRTIAGLIRMTSARPEAVPAAYEGLKLACRDPGALSGESYMPLLETCLQLIDRYKGPHPEAAARFLDCADSLFSWLSTGGTSSNGGGVSNGGTATNTNTNKLSDEALVDLWLTSVGVMARGLCREDSRDLRDSSIAALHRTLIASSTLNLPSELWVQTTSELLIPLVSDLAKLAGNPKAAKARPGLEKSVRLAVNMLTKVLLQYTPLMAQDRDFYALWASAFEALQGCMGVRHEAVMEAVPENVKNLLLVLASSGVLTPEWREVGQGRSLWELTWTKAVGISSGLTPDLVQSVLAVAAAPVAAPQEEVEVEDGQQQKQEQEGEAVVVVVGGAENENQLKDEEAEAVADEEQERQEETPGCKQS